MPNGVPVATVALNASKNPGLLAVQILAINDLELSDQYKSYKERMKKEVLLKDDKLQSGQDV